MTAAPDHLGDAGKALWDSIAPKYQLRPDELYRLDLACRAADMLHDLESEWIQLGSPKMSRGSTGQEAIHYLIGEMRAQRADLNRALAALKLPDDIAPATAGDESTKARAAAAARWAGGA